jgi:medium-chain acyl-[acyl-carrier-protein] hydrolase
MADLIFPDNSISSGDRWLAASPQNPRAPLRLFCFPHSGAGAYIFRAWLPSFPAHIEVCPVRLPGRENRIDEPLIADMPALVRATAAGLRPYLDRPFAFFGHSMGALLSFELARFLRRHYRLSAVRLFVSGHGAPHLPAADPPCHALPEAEFVAKLRELHGTPDEVLDNLELRALILPIVRADFAVCETYAYEEDEPLACPISAFGGRQDACVSRADLEAWSVHTRADFSARLLPGDHFFLHQARVQLIRLIEADLINALQPREASEAYEPAALASAA